MSSYLDKTGLTYWWGKISPAITSALTPPVGSLILSQSESYDPSTVYKGTSWTKIDDGQILRSAGATLTAGQSSGSDSYKLTTSVMPAHTHTVSVSKSNSDNYRSGLTDTGIHQDGAKSVTTSSTGSGSAFNIQPLSEGVIVWRRTA